MSRRVQPSAYSCCPTNHLSPLASQVQSGGAFDVDYTVKGPDKIILSGEKERQGDFVFTATQVGDYEFCFSNEMSTYADKFVDFEIAVENESKAQLPSKQGTSPEQTSVLEESVFKISGQLSTISRNQKYFRTRENRNFSTVRSTEKRIVNFSLIQCGLIICMGALQVFIVRFFFQVSQHHALQHLGVWAKVLAGGSQRLCIVSQVCPAGNRVREAGMARSW
jgi:hypothetical protein